MKLKTTEIHEKRELKKDPKKFAYNRFFEGEKLPEFPLVGKQAWLKINPSGKIERVVKTLEWKLGFDVEHYAEEFVNASLSGDFSKLPDLLTTGNGSSSFSLVFNLSSGFSTDVLGLAEEDREHLQSLVLDGVEGGWKYNFFSGSTCKWTNCGMESRGAL